MAIHLKAFKEGLYQEHLEEASFLYETRLAWSQDDEIGWMDLEDLDDRIEAHIDGLIVGESLALNLCLNQLEEAEASELHVIVRVICRYKLVKHLSKLWEIFDYDDEDNIRAVSDALSWECPKEWFAPLIKVFSSARTQLFPILSATVARNTNDSAKYLIPSLSSVDETYIANTLFDMSRCVRTFSEKDKASIRKYLKHDNKQVVSQAALLLLMNKDQTMQASCQTKVAVLPLMTAISGNASSAKKLLDITTAGKATGDILLALGLAGDPESIPYLISYLKHPDYAPLAAQGLQIISGADLYDEVHVPEDVEEVDLFDYELEDFKKGVLPKNIDGLDFGGEVIKISEKSEIWEHWYKEHQNEFQKGVRYRNGKIFSANELLNALFTNRTPWLIRRLAYEECVIRYGLDVSLFDIDLISIQKQKLNEIYSWGTQHQSFIDGRWYFAGHEILS